MVKLVWLIACCHLLPYVCFTMNFQSPPHWLRPVCAMLALLLVVGLFAGASLPVASNLFHPPWDKVAHAATFAVLAMLLAVALRDAHLLHGQSAISPVMALGLGWALAAMVGGADEIHQIWIPGRVADWYDWFADVLGSGVATGALWWLQGASRRAP